MREMMNGELAHRTDFGCFFQMARAQGGAGYPVDIRLAPIEAERKTLTESNE